MTDNVTVTEVPNENVKVPDITPTQAAFRMLMAWAREVMPDGNRRMPDGMLNAACMHMVASLCAAFENETGDDVLPGLQADMATLFADYKAADLLRRAKPQGAPQ